MVFSSLLFLTLFLPLTFLLYNIAPKKLKNVLLLAVSFIFYGWGEPVYVLLMLVTTLYIWVLTGFIEKAREAQKQGLARFLLILCLVFALGLLGYFKYFGFILENLHLSSLLSLKAPVLPIGISFYTFQALSYVIDVYRGELKAQRSWINFAMYISLFPQLIAGPIVRYADIEGQLEDREITADGLSEGIVLFIIGLGKKVLLANQAGFLWDEISSLSSLSFVNAWIGAAAFALQIYFDFSGYSDMAVGLGKMFGFSFPKNFDYPYQAKSVTEFWRRWHITLGVWFREYVYIPLGGNRVGKSRLIFNLFVVWALTGLWHGAAWQFVLWGLYYFVFLAAEKIGLMSFCEKLPDILRHLLTMLIVLLGWVLFACDDLSSAGEFYRAMFCIGRPFADASSGFYLSANLLMLVVLSLGSTELPKKLFFALKSKLSAPAFKALSLLGLVLVLFTSLSFLAADGYNPFLYFRF